MREHDRDIWGDQISKAVFLMCRCTPSNLYVFLSRLSIKFIHRMDSVLGLKQSRVSPADNLASRETGSHDCHFIYL